ncbi:MAG: glycoside hydrolase family 88 protein [Pirellulaceae bacterium]
MNFSLLKLFVALCALVPAIPEGLAQAVDQTPLVNTPGVLPVFVGVTRANTPIPAYITGDDLDIHIKKTRVLIVAGLDGDTSTSKAAINVMRRFYSEAEFERLREMVSLSIVPCGNPDGQAKGLRHDNGEGGDPSRGYPPTGAAYLHPTNPESQYLWRWVGMHAPDIVVEFVSQTDLKKVEAEFVSPTANDCLAKQLPIIAPCQVGNIPAYTLAIPAGNVTPFAQFTDDLLAEVNSPSFERDNVDFSKARRELQARDQRTAIEIGKQLASVYGHELSSVAYIPAVACIGRLRLAELTGDKRVLPEMQQLTAEYYSGAKPTLTDHSGGSEIAGHILWSEMKTATGDAAYVKLAQQAADRAFSSDGQLLEAMPTHNEMSDAVFMGCPILAQVGSMTGESKYFEMCLRHMRFMLKLNLRSDGLHRHSPLDEAAWGRGNGFPALGLALSLDAFPQEHPGRMEMLDAFRQHMKALLAHQDVTGAWHQVIDHPESYRELTATSMITFAMLRGIRNGWLPREEFQPAVERGWKAVKARVAADGSLVDVCTGTGKQKSLRDYLDRTAILGKDSRGGAMALLLATEIASWEIEQTATHR